MRAESELYKNLPETFKRMEAKRLVHQMGYSRSWFNQQLENWMFEGKLQRIERGVYQKTGS